MPDEKLRANEKVNGRPAGAKKEKRKVAVPKRTR